MKLVGEKTSIFSWGNVPVSHNVLAGGGVAGMLRFMSKSAFPLRFKLASSAVMVFATVLAWLPLRVIHGLGAVLGRLIVYFDRGFRAQIAENLTQAGWPATLQRVGSELGKGILEIVVAWRRSPAHVASLVREVDGWHHFEVLQQTGKGIVWVTPHLGCSDIAGRYISMKTPVLAMYRPPKLAWLEPLMIAGRERDSGAVARADVSGVRLMLKTLKTGGSIIVLPDQVPSGGDGEWAPFFDRPAYTMTLVPRLAQSTGAAVLMFYAERLPKGRGFKVWISPLDGEFGQDKQQNAITLNRNVERLIRHCPEQYLWSYRRYKTPAGVVAPHDGLKDLTS